MINSKKNLRLSLIAATDGILDILKSDSFIKSDDDDFYYVDINLLTESLSEIVMAFKKIKSDFETESSSDINLQVGSMIVTTKMWSFNLFYLNASKAYQEYVLIDFYFWFKQRYAHHSQSTLELFTEYLNVSDLQKSPETLEKEYFYHEFPSWPVRGLDRHSNVSYLDIDYNFVNFEYCYDGTVLNVVEEPVDSKFNNKVLRRLLMNYYYQKRNM